MSQSMLKSFPHVLVLYGLKIIIINMRYLVLAALVATQAYGAALDFIMVGDFGWTFNMTLPHMNFDGINYYVGNLTEKGGKIDFMMTMGDNMYLANETHPT